TTAMTNAMIASTLANGDSDLRAVATVDAGVLNVKAGKSLYLWAGKTFSPGGNVNVGSALTLQGTLTAGSATLSLFGSWTKASGGTFTAGTSTLRLNGTSQTLSGSTTFYN